MLCSKYTGRTGAISFFTLDSFRFVVYLFGCNSLFLFECGNFFCFFFFKVQAGDRVAQLILERIAIAEVKEVGELPLTERGAGGFGSTGFILLKVISFLLLTSY